MRTLCSWYLFFRFYGWNPLAALGQLRIERDAYMRGLMVAEARLGYSIDPAEYYPKED